MNNRIIYPFVTLTNTQGKKIAIVADEIEALNVTSAEVTQEKDGVETKKRIDVTIVVCKTGAQYGVFEGIEQIGALIEAAVNMSLKSLSSAKSILLANGQRLGV